MLVNMMTPKMIERFSEKFFRHFFLIKRRKLEFSLEYIVLLIPFIKYYRNKPRIILLSHSTSKHQLNTWFNAKNDQMVDIKENAKNDPEY